MSAESEWIVRQVLGVSADREKSSFPTPLYLCMLDS